MSKRKRFDDSDTKHHRLTRHQGGITDETNISVVPFGQHMAYNTLFSDGHLHPRAMARLLTDVWIRPDYRMLAFKKPHTCTNCGQCKITCQGGNHEDGKGKREEA